MSVASGDEIGLFFPGVIELERLYRDLDREIGRFKQQAGLDCPPFCKKCCETGEEQIEVSVFECLPLSLHLWKRGEAESLLQMIASGGGKGRCVLYLGDSSPPAGWGCSHYDRRPLICRLFGFSAVLDKRGRARVALCRTLKEADPRAEERVRRGMERGLRPPILSHWAWKASSLNPHLGQRRHPINQALRLALEKTGLQLKFMKGDEDIGRIVLKETLTMIDA